MFASLPPATRKLLLANISVFLLQFVLGERLMELGALWPPGEMFRPWQVVTYAFLHGSFAHLFFNMFALYMFGGELESYWGSRRFVAFWFVCVLTAAAAQMAVGLVSGLEYPTVGASGGIFGLLLAFAMLFPQRRVTLLIPPIPMPAWLFVTLYGLLELYLGVTGTQAGVAHFAHLGGMLGGWIAMRWWRHRDAQAPRW